MGTSDTETETGLSPIEVLESSTWVLLNLQKMLSKNVGKGIPKGSKIYESVVQVEGRGRKERLEGAERL